MSFLLMRQDKAGRLQNVGHDPLAERGDLAAPSFRRKKRVHFDHKAEQIDRQEYHPAVVGCVGLGEWVGD